MILCACGSQKTYTSCCGPYLENTQTPDSPEKLMRSRYTAYSLGNIEYIKRTMRGKALQVFMESEAKNHEKKMTWIHLKILNNSLPSPEQGYVEFIATYLKGNTTLSIHEKSEFKKYHGNWFYVDGIHLPAPAKQKISNNSPCPCGSLKKFKNCHG